MIHWLACLLLCLWTVTSSVSSAAILTHHLDPEVDAPRYVTDDVNSRENDADKFDGNELLLSEMRRLGIEPRKTDAKNLLAEFTDFDNGSGPTQEDLISEKRAFNPWAGKRAFSPWAGKRVFSPWAGKRSFSPWAGKRAFNPWGGKRALSELGEQEDKRRFSPWAGKRAFNPWAGKRSNMSLDKDQDDKRQFTPWGGKRGGKRGSFNPWAGKRSDVRADDKRAFSPWGGKRTEPASE